LAAVAREWRNLRKFHEEFTAFSADNCGSYQLSPALMVDQRIRLKTCNKRRCFRKWP